MDNNDFDKDIQEVEERYNEYMQYIKRRYEWSKIETIILTILFMYIIWVTW